MKEILDFLYPPRCQLCGNNHSLTASGLLCEPCTTDLRPNKHACQVCAIPLSPRDQTDSHLSKTCAQCIRTPPLYDFSWSAFIYAQPLEWMIQQLKFNAKLDLAHLLSHLMLLKLRSALTGQLNNENKPDVIIPMPLHKKRLKQRGFNQSHLLIKPIANALDLPIDISSCERIRDTEHQTGKNAQQRRQNIKNAFAINVRHSYRHVVIFDDVVTTGSSVSELSKTLKNAGVQRVDIWSLARAEKTI